MGGKPRAKSKAGITDGQYMALTDRIIAACDDLGIKPWQAADPLMNAWITICLETGLGLLDIRYLATKRCIEITRMGE